ncbi:nucleotide exchange factor GrpE [Moorella sulfitireducens (nom. illeg.)]|uniref:nucleotide exchange factor GrpE n=1 Tax=Neomoorella sulfitireducens TaxID=2972948 RepID=UPI0021AC5E78|nr:nucleotide exchange factor GrpE [Moorella sulfitireducens]
MEPNRDNKMNNGMINNEREDGPEALRERPAGEAGECHGRDEESPGARVEEPAGAGGEPAGATGREELSRLEEELAARAAALSELQQRFLRLQADFDNYRKRTRREQEEMTRLANARLIESLLPVLDNLELALATAAGTGKQALETGVEMTLRQLQEILAREGLMPVAALGRPFDPEVHEAVAREETAEPDKINQVVEEFRRGYTLHGRLLRPAMVKVAVAAGAGEQENQEDPHAANAAASEE